MFSLLPLDSFFECRYLIVLSKVDRVDRSVTFSLVSRLFFPENLLESHRHLSRVPEILQGNVG